MIALRGALVWEAKLVLLARDLMIDDTDGALTIYDNMNNMII